MLSKKSILDGWLGRLRTTSTGRSRRQSCGGLINEAVLERERRQRPPGYDRNPNAPGDPQVVSMNGVLASEACNAALDLITGYAAGSRGTGWWNYNGRSGELVRCETPPR